jgi:hypothetical protein
MLSSLVPTVLKVHKIQGPFRLSNEPPGFFILYEEAKCTLIIVDRLILFKCQRSNSVHLVILQTHILLIILLKAIDMSRRGVKRQPASLERRHWARKRASTNICRNQRLICGRLGTGWYNGLKSERVCHVGCVASILDSGVVIHITCELWLGIVREKVWIVPEDRRVRFMSVIVDTIGEYIEFCGIALKYRKWRAVYRGLE